MLEEHVKFKKSRLTIALMICFMLVATAMPVFASNDNHSYAFTIKTHYGNTYSPSRYRETTNPQNQWKVNLAYSAEGAGTYITFWLSKASNKVVTSGIYDVQQGSGAHYYNATNGANATDVCLSAENNNDSANTYAISGYWDEEIN
jgi:hypothetical protein